MVGRYLLLVYLALAWAAGLLVASWLGAPWWAWTAGGVLTLGWAVVSIRARHRDALLAGCAVLFAVGGLRYTLARPQIDAGHIAYYNGSGFVTLEGLVVDAPEPRERATLLRVRAERLALEDEEAQTAHGNVLVQAVGVGHVRYGDSVRIMGRLETPPESEDFSYRDYLAREGIYSLIQYGSVEVTGPRRGNPALRVLFDFRESAQAVIVDLLPDPEASLLSGILLGIEYNISPEVEAAFHDTGLTHVIAISGFNMTIISAVLMGTLTPLIGFRRATLATIIGVALYSLFVGGDAAVWRAAVMGVLTVIAMRTGRPAYGPTSLAAAALALTIFNPYWLWDVSFQLSFFATVGLLVYVRPFEQALLNLFQRWLPAERASQLVALLSEPVVVTLSATLTTTPLIAHYFGRLSLISPLANLLALPVQPLVMLLGGVAVLAAMIVRPLGQVIVWLAWVPLAWTIGVARTLSRIPGASTTVTLSSQATWALYGLLFGLTALCYLSPEQRTSLWGRLRRHLGMKALATSGLLIGALVWMAWARLPDGRLHIVFGEHVALITTPSGRHILVNGGSSTRRLHTILGDWLPFWERQIDAWLVTCPQASATSSTTNAFERYHVGAVLVGDFEREDELESLLSGLAAADTPIVTAADGASIVIGDGVHAIVLEADGAGDIFALLIHYGEAQVLITSGLPLDDWPSAPYATIREVESAGPEGNTPQVIIAAGATEEPLSFSLEGGQTLHISTDGSTLWVWGH